MKNILLIITVLMAVLAGCQKKADLGTEDNPLVWSFVPSGDAQEIAAGGRETASVIFEKTGLVVKTNVATEYAGVIEAMSSDPPSVHISSLPTFSYIVAADRGAAEAALVSVRFGRPFYDGQIIVAADSDIRKLEDLAGKTFARPDPLSSSGWIIPSLTMRSAGINPERDLSEIVDAGGHTSVIAAVYSGSADAGATYTGAHNNVKDDFPDVEEKIRVITTTPPIPNDGVQFHPSVPLEIREKIIRALMEMTLNDSEVKPLKDAYGWDSLERHEDDFYDPFRQILQAAGVDAASLAGS